MRLFNFNITKADVPKQQTSTDRIEFAVPSIPVIKEVRGKDWVYFGEDNLYPIHLDNIVMMSPTQGAIIKGTASMMAGDGFLINGTSNEIQSKAKLLTMPDAVQSEYKKFLKNENGTLTIEQINRKLALDYRKYGAMALEVVWSMDFTRIATIKYVEVGNVRSGKMVNGKPNEYWYSRDWSVYTKEGFIPSRIAAFDENNKTDYNQLIYIKAGNLEYYGDPVYSEGMSWVEIEGKLANFHLSNISNGFAPSMALKFFQKPGSPEEQSAIVNGIKKQYSGTSNAGKALFFFSDGKENAPEISDIPVSNLDKQYTSVNDLCIQNILTSNQITSPLLFGIATPGQLGAGTELETAYKILNNSVIAPDRKILEEIWNNILTINKVGILIEIAPFNPLADKATAVAVVGNPVVDALNSLSPLLATKVLETMSIDEIRNLIGLKPAEAEVPALPDSTNTQNT